MCAYMDRGEDEEEASSLLSYTLRYVSLAELGTVCRVEVFGYRDDLDFEDRVKKISFFCQKSIFF